MSHLPALYDDQEQYSASEVGLRREQLPHLVRHVDLLGKSSTVIHSRLSAETTDAAIEEQMGYFARLGQGFEWTAFSHDQPPDLVLTHATACSWTGSRARDGRRE